MNGYPQLLQPVLDTADVRGLAEFYRRFLGLRYRPGDELAQDSTADTADWLVLTDDKGSRKLAFQQAEHHQPTTWPSPEVPMQMHLDFTVADRQALTDQHARVLALGAKLLLDRTEDSEEPLYVYADPAGHPFCIFVG